jgi:hypothetical protein
MVFYMQRAQPAETLAQFKKAGKVTRLRLNNGAVVLAMGSYKKSFKTEVYHLVVLFNSTVKN